MAKNSQLNSVFDPPKVPTCKPTIGGPDVNGVTGPNLQKRTSSPAAENEKLFENVAGSTASKA